MDVMVGLSAGAQLIDLFKGVQEINDNLKSAELKLKLAEINDKLAEVITALSQAKLDIQSKNEEIAALKLRSSRRIETVRFGAYEYGLNSDGSHFPRPFCPKCLQASGEQSSLNRGTAGKNVCPSCNATYNARETNAPY